VKDVFKECRLQRLIVKGNTGVGGEHLEKIKFPLEMGGEAQVKQSL
jgi:hypothetical protein